MGQANTDTHRRHSSAEGFYPLPADLGEHKQFITLKQACFQELPQSAVCVQRSFDSRNSASHGAYRTLLRPSSLPEPRHPSLKVVIRANSEQPTHKPFLPPFFMGFAFDAPLAVTGYTRLHGFALESQAAASDSQ